jgi:mono/diheme cytochrome c family protein
MADMGGPKRAMAEIMGQRAAAARKTAAPAAAAAAATAGPVSGQMLFEKTAGGTGCAVCHGPGARGGGPLNAPDIRGVGEDRIRGALAAVPAMSRITLSDAELAAIVSHLAELNKAP